MLGCIVQTGPQLLVVLLLLSLVLVLQSGITIFSEFGFTRVSVYRCTF